MFFLVATIGSSPVLLTGPTPYTPCLELFWLQ